MAREVGLYLRLKVANGKAAVTAAAPLPRWSRELLRAPLLTRETCDRFTLAGSELVLSLLDAKGGVLATFAFPETPQVYFDRRAAEPDFGLAGATGDPKQTMREVQLPLIGAAAFLAIHRSELTFVEAGAKQRSQLKQAHVALYSMARPGKPVPAVPPLPVAPKRRPRAAAMPWLAPWPERTTPPARRPRTPRVRRGK